MKRLLLVALFVLGLATVAEAQSKLDLPKGWQAERMGPKDFVFSTGLDKWGETELPPSPYPWLIVMQPKDDTCDLDSSRPPVFEPKKQGLQEFREAATCKFGFFVLIGYWDKDPTQKEHVSEMLEILEKIGKMR